MFCFHSFKPTKKRTWCGAFPLIIYLFPFFFFSLSPNLNLLTLIESLVVFIFYERQWCWKLPILWENYYFLLWLKKPMDPSEPSLLFLFLKYFDRILFESLVSFQLNYYLILLCWAIWSDDWRFGNKRCRSKKRPDYNYLIFGFSSVSSSFSLSTHSLTHISISIGWNHKNHYSVLIWQLIYKTYRIVLF